MPARGFGGGGVGLYRGAGAATGARWSVRLELAMELTIQLQRVFARLLL